MCAEIIELHRYWCKKLKLISCCLATNFKTFPFNEVFMCSHMILVWHLWSSHTIWNESPFINDSHMKYVWYTDVQLMKVHVLLFYIFLISVYWGMVLPIQPPSPCQVWLWESWVCATAKWRHQTLLYCRIVSHKYYLLSLLY